MNHSIPLRSGGDVAVPAGLAGTAAFVPGRQRARLLVADRRGGPAQVVLDSADLIEAPNWSPCGRWLVFNRGGALWRVAVNGPAAPERIASGHHAPANNDHVLSPDGSTIYFSTDDGHLWAVPFAGGEPCRVSNEHAPQEEFRYYLHGVSPDGSELAYVGLRRGAQGVDYGLYTVPAAGGPDRTLLRAGVPVDGPEYSPDGQWIYFNGELDARTPGHSQLYRMRRDGSGVQALTHDERVNWFPHLSPDGCWLLYLSYPPGTTGHPANRPVRLRLAAADGHAAADFAALFGGQGTVNVNSWAPDSARFAYVDYPAAQPAAGTP